MSKGYLTKRFEYHAFYQRQYRLGLYFTILILLAALGVLGKIFYVHFSIVTPPYFATTSDGRLIEVKPVRN